MIELIMEYKNIIQYSVLFNKSKKSIAEIKDIIYALPYDTCLKALSFMLNVQGHLLKEEKEMLEIIKGLYLFKRNLPFEQNEDQIPKENIDYFNNGVLGNQILLFTYKWILVYGNEALVEDALSADNCDKLLHLIILLADYLPQEEVKNNKNEFLWNTLHFNTSKVPKYELARAYKIFCKEDYFKSDYKDSFLKKYKLSISKYLYLIFLFIQGIVENPTVAVDEKEVKGFSVDLREKFLITPSELKEKLKPCPLNSWDYSLFYENPLILFNDKIVPISSSLICANFFEYLYWKIRFSTNKENKSFIDDFGSSFEKYVQRLTEETCKKSSCLFVNEFEMENSTRSSDAYIIKDDIMLIIEAKAKSPVAASYSMKDIKSINKDVQRLFIEPICQADRCYQLLLEQKNDTHGFISRKDSIKKIIILSVTMEKIQPVKQLYDEARKLFSTDSSYEIKQKTYSTKLMTENIVSTMNVNIYEFEKLCAVLENSNITTLVKTVNELITSSDDNYYDVLDNILRKNNLSDYQSSFVEDNYKNFTEESSKFIQSHENNGTVV